MVNDINTSQDIEDKTPPHNYEIEKMVLGTILRNNPMLERADTLQEKHFYAPEHGIIFTWIVQLLSKGQTASPLTLAHYADTEPAVKALGGTSYLADLVAEVFSIVNISELASTLVDLYAKRQLIEIGTDLVNQAYANTIDTTASMQIESAEQTLFNLAETGDSTKSVIGLNIAAAQALETAEKAFLADGQIAGLTTGLSDLDNTLGGLHGSDLLILAGRPAMGKTALVTNLAFSAANKYAVKQKDNGEEYTEGGVVLFFSLEMSAEQLAGRILSEQAEISSEKIRRGEINSDEFQSLAHATDKLSRVPLFIDDTPGLSVTAVRQRARRLQRKQGLHLIVVDYLQLLQPPTGRRIEGRVNEVSEITRTLKIIAKELNVPVIALSQLSRKVEEREDKRPILSDLRESGSIEQDADLVMFIYRPEYYLQREHPEKRANEGDDKYNNRVEDYNERCNNARNVAEVVIAKNRHGSTGIVELFFNGEFAKFGDLHRGH